MKKRNTKSLEKQKNETKRKNKKSKTKKKSESVFTRYELYFDDTRLKPYSFDLRDEEDQFIYDSPGRYATKKEAIEAAKKALNLNLRLTLVYYY
jgi:hypothetical protein